MTAADIREQVANGHTLDRFRDDPFLLRLDIEVLRAHIEEQSRMLRAWLFEAREFRRQQPHLIAEGLDLLKHVPLGGESALDSDSDGLDSRDGLGEERSMLVDDTGQNVRIGKRVSLKLPYVSELRISFAGQPDDGCADSVDDRGESIGWHGDLLALHGLRTRYVTGALLAACWWLQRKSLARRFAGAVRRLSGLGGVV